MGKPGDIAMHDDYQRIEAALRFLEGRFRDQPRLEDLAEHLHLSVFHTQRLFQQWAGISPKRFLQFLTVEYAKQLLAESRSVLDATYEAGLSGPGRLHDLFVTAEAMTPGEYKARGEALEIRYGFGDGPFGECLIAATSRGVCHLAFSGEDREAALASLQGRWPGAQFREDGESAEDYRRRIFPEGSRDGLAPVPVLLKGTNFQIQVWRALLRIPAGRAQAYEDVAAAVGKPGAVRAVGQAVAANPVAYLIPCHRVIRKLGVVGDYRWGATRKRAMLGWEAARRNPVEDEI
ncbi:MAG: methylated-DNA--[protein]-cysteine S-methyltransferase [Candidatus Zixiibacteriota bacterium]|nr:MAG: methylated-DNA--[protein]-cysteine S-methyltransferase [candidate division Zixibacteria bacterium]